jgi:hypothetical protein
MRIAYPKVEIGETEGFTKEKDIFDRASFGAGLMNLLSSVEEPLVVMIDGQWGSGKTIFVKMWAGLLRQNGFPVVYFDAFENDYMSDAFTALAGEVVSLASKSLGSSNPDYASFVAKTKSVGKVLLRSALKIGVKAATLGALNADDVGEVVAGVSSEIAGEASDIADQFVGELLERHEGERTIFDRFRNALSEIPGLVAESGETGKSLPLVFIVDELDRCKPTFALELLERIKHFLSVPNIHFVLVTHRAHLESSVRFAYGQDVDAQSYLEKFYTISIQLPTGDIDRPGFHTKKYLDSVFKTLPADSDNGTLSESVIEIIWQTALIYGLSFRTLERIATHVALMFAFTNNKVLRLAPVVTGLCIFKAVRPQLFAKAQNGSLEMKDVENFFQFSRWVEGGNVGANWCHGWWSYCLAEELDSESKEYRHVLFQYNIGDRKRIVPIMATRVVNAFQISRKAFE